MADYCPCCGRPGENIEAEMVAKFAGVEVDGRWVSYRNSRLGIEPKCAKLIATLFRRITVTREFLMLELWPMEEIGNLTVQLCRARKALREIAAPVVISWRSIGVLEVIDTAKARPVFVPAGARAESLYGRGAEIDLLGALVDRKKRAISE